jgi:DNA mismatch endonuclease (patch repair protein)
MRRIKSRDTTPEMLVRRLVHRMGYRYRLHRTDLPGKPDLAFIGRRKVIFVHGCFWHAHGCKLSHVPKSNAAYWLPKLRRNKMRDASSAAALTALGWRHLIIWECELTRLSTLRQRIARFLH